MTDIAEREDVNLDDADYPERIPKFASEEEARDFWDTHDSAPYWDQMEDVTNSPPPELRRGPGRAGSRARRRPSEGRMDLVSLRLPAEMIDEVKAIASVRHLPYQTLIRSWIGERVDKEREAIRRGA